MYIRLDIDVENADSTMSLITKKWAMSSYLGESFLIRAIINDVIHRVLFAVLLTNFFFTIHVLLTTLLLESFIF